MAKLELLDLENEYNEHLSNFEKLRILIIKEIEALLHDNNVKIGFPVQSRIKDINSIFEKHESQRYRIKKSLLELQDLIGIRIVLLFRRDIAVVSELIEKNFKVLSSYDPSEKLNYDQFGYSSKHYVVNIPESWTNVPTNKNLDSYTVEMQVRTLSQHNWAETSNFFQYKNEANVPKEILRTIGRVSALLETVDLELERTLSERDVYISKIDIEKNQELNIETMKAVFQKYLPKSLDHDYQNYSSLLEMLTFFKIFNISELINLIRNYVEFVENNVIKFWDEKIQKWQKYDGEYKIDSISNLFIILLSYYNYDLWNEFVDKISNEPL